MPEPDAARTVVIVEDDAAMRQATERVLRLHGIAATSFGSAESALADGRAAAADCLIVDIRLPGLSGIELCKRIAAAGPLPPVVFITAHDEARFRQAANRLGAAAFFVKPFSGRDLADIVNNVLERA